MKRIAPVVLAALFVPPVTACSSSSGPGSPEPPGSPETAEPGSAATSGEDPQPVAPADVSAEERAAACQAIVDWRSEIIELPPEFAPSLPAGREELRFAPGMFEADSETYFTYAFVLSFAAGTALDPAALKAILDAYYRGLTRAVAESKKLELPIDEIASRVEPDGQGLRATIAMYDAFVTGEALELELRMTVAGTCVTVQASPRPAGDAVWAMLEKAATCLVCPPGNAPE